MSPRASGSGGAAAAAGDAALLAELVEAELGLRLEPARAAALAARRGLVDRLREDPRAVEALASELTIGETYFFRHIEQLHAFRDVALPDRLAAMTPAPGAMGGASSARAVRVLSAGCSSGEEPYSLAMIVRHEVPEAVGRVAVDAIDVNPAAIEKARKARYTRWSLRSVPPEIERRWFTKEGALFVVAPEVRGDVTFRRGSLTDDAVLGGQRYDVVFCRNVLMYFGAAALAATLQRLTDALLPGGFLFLGHAEILRDLPVGLSLCESHGTFYYRKGARLVAAAGRASAGLFAIAPVEEAPWYTAIQAASERVRRLAEGTAPVATPAPLLDGPAIKRACEALAREDYVGALAALERVRDTAEVAVLRAIALTELGETARAAEACAAILEMPGVGAREEAQAHYLLAVGHDSAGELAHAARHARRATELAPDLAMAHVRLGLVARRIGDPHLARRALATACDALASEPAAQLALHAGGLGRDALIGLCRAELAAIAAEHEAARGQEETHEDHG